MHGAPLLQAAGTYGPVASSICCGGSSTYTSELFTYMLDRTARPADQRAVLCRCQASSTPGVATVSYAA
jgi:hypothetical protein